MTDLEKGKITNLVRESKHKSGLVVRLIANKCYEDTFYFLFFLPTVLTFPSSALYPCLISLHQIMRGSSYWPVAIWNFPPWSSLLLSCGPDLKSGRRRPDNSSRLLLLLGGGGTGQAKDVPWKTNLEDSSDRYGAEP